MIGVDTNVLVRYLVQDDAAQSAAATRFLEHDLSVERKGFVSSIVLCELAWVLARTYKLARGELARILERVLGVEVLAHEHVASALVALQEFRAGQLSFADCLIVELCAGAGCAEIATFDKALSRRQGVRLLN